MYVEGFSTSFATISLQIDYLETRPSLYYLARLFRKIQSIRQIEHFFLMPILYPIHL